MFCSSCSTTGVSENLKYLDDSLVSYSVVGASFSIDPIIQDRNETLVNATLEAPIGLTEVQKIALLNSVELKMIVTAMLSDIAGAKHNGRISNPRFSFERISSPGELELTRVLTLGLFELLTLPKRTAIADLQVDLVRIRMVSSVLDYLAQVKIAWVEAVAAKEALEYAKKALDSAQASAELAGRMELTGNFNKLERAREHAHYSNMATKFALAKHEAVTLKENLGSMLSLDSEQRKNFKLPERLPDLPNTTISVDALEQAINHDRIDVRVAKNELLVLGEAYGLQTIDSFTDVEMSLVDKTEFDGDRGSSDGFELEIALPLFDWGGQKREMMTQRIRSASYRYEYVIQHAANELKNSYQTYLVSYEIARHYRDEIVPLRKIISEENLLRYNGMIIGVFELLVDSREQISAVIGAIDSKKQFWISHVVLDSAMIGNLMTARSFKIKNV